MSRKSRKYIMEALLFTNPCYTESLHDSHLIILNRFTVYSHGQMSEHPQSHCVFC